MRVKPSASVIIPTFNRSAKLDRTLRALQEQTVAHSTFEVLVVDDGSQDDTARVVASHQAGSPVPIHYLFQPNRKQGVARNLGARNAAGEFLVFLGDDTVPVPAFLEEHLKSHFRFRTGETMHRTVVIGYTPWDVRISVTRFLRYIGEQGWQFGFSLIEDPDNVPFNFFYTSNLSIQRSFFLQAGGFDENFQEYGWEDIELSFRLSRLGMRMAFNPRAVACHDHPTSLDSFIRRQHQVGCAAWKLYRKHPELADFLAIHRLPRYTARARLRFFLLTWACRVTERLSWPDLSRYYPDLLSYYYNLGLWKAKNG